MVPNSCPTEGQTGARGAPCGALHGCDIRFTRTRLADIVVRLNHVFKNYRRGELLVSALHDICLSVAPGQFCALVGPSGCGKSTLINLIAGFDVPTSGEVTVAGQSVRNLPDSEWTRLRREVIGVVFQAFHLFPGFTATENVALPLLLRGTPARDAYLRAAEALEIVGLGHRERHRPGELSGGEQQRVAIARALVHRPLLLLADEPTGNLDSKTGAEIISLLGSLPRRSGQTVILATHSQAAARQADCVHVMKDGRIIGSLGQFGYDAG